MPVEPSRLAVARRAGCVALAGALAALAGGCSNSSGAPGTGGAGAVNTAHITITAARGCASDHDTVSAGGVTFLVKNVDATAVSEVELLDGERIVGEKENLPPGLSGQFAVNLAKGRYTVYCPGAKVEKTTLTVTGSGPAVDPAGDGIAALLKSATSEYKVYVDTQVGYLLSGVTKLDSALHGASLRAAQRDYMLARPFYEKIEPVAESFTDGTDNLDADIDARAGDVPAAQWRGFHPIEKGLFQDRSLAGLAALGDRLVADVRKLQTKTAALSYQAPDLANGAQELLDEVASSKITGEEERYSHIDILDMANNIEGSEQAFADLQPALGRIDSALAAQIAAEFAALDELVQTYRSTANASGYVLYGALSDTDRKNLAAAVKAVQEPLSQVASKVAG